MEFRSGCPPCPSRHNGDRRGPLPPGEQGRQAGRAAPVVTDEENAVEIELVNQCDEIRRVVIQAVRTGAVGMLRQAKPNLVRHDHPIPCREQRRDGVAPEVAPSGIAVQQQHGRRVGRAFVNVVHSPTVDVGELRPKRVTARHMRGKVADFTCHGVIPGADPGALQPLPVQSLRCRS